MGEWLISAFCLLCGDTGSKNRGSWAASTEQQFLTRNLEWSLHVCILQDMFNDKFTLRRDFLSDEQGLRRRFMIVGLLQLALMPFLLIFMVVQFFLQVRPISLLSNTSHWPEGPM